MSNDVVSNRTSGSATTTPADAASTGTTLQVGDLVVATDKIWAESQTFLHFMRRQTGSRIPLSKRAVFRVSDVIHSSGNFILNLTNVFADGGDGDTNNTEEDHTRQLLGSESMIFCSKGDEKKLEVLERASAVAANNDAGDDANTEESREAKSNSSDDDDDEDPVLLLDCAPYQDIIRLMHRGLGLPVDVGKHMTRFLEIKHVDESEISVTGASSTRGDFPLSSVLGDAVGTWWISAEGSMQSGQGKEYLEFRLSSNGTARRCSYVGLSIPPLPQGPLSVRGFRIDWSYDGKEWTEGRHRYIMETMDMAGMQSFKLERPIDASRVRLVCLSNAFASARGGTSPFDCVGLFYVRWK